MSTILVRLLCVKSKFFFMFYRVFGQNGWKKCCWGECHSNRRYPDKDSDVIIFSSSLYNAVASA